MPTIGPEEARALLAALTVLALLGAVADTLMLFAPGFSLNPFKAALTIPRGRIVAGLFLGLLVIPCYGAGYWLVYRRLIPAGAGYALPVLALGLVGVVWGVVFHTALGTALLGAQAARPAPDEVLNAWEPSLPVLVPLFVVLHLLLVIGSVSLSLALHTGLSDLPRRLTWLSPAVVTLVLFALSLLKGHAGDLLQPAALNLAHAVFFAAVWSVT